jgi:putative transposase
MNRACAAVGLSRATAYRQFDPPTPRRQGPRRAHPRRIPDSERSEILALLDSERFVDQPPREAYATLLSEGEYRCSWRTMYRVLCERAPIRERRNHREPRHHAIPRLEASAPNDVWSWDISKLPSYVSGVFFNLYVVLDLFSRFVVAWMVAERENSALAKQLFAEAISRYGIEPGQLIVHQDRGAPMTAHGFTELLSELGVERSYSRPRVSNDNPFSESTFHTVKYQPDYPGRFRDVRHARRWCEDFFAWYNEDHHHSGLALFTPADVYHGRVEEVARRREDALAQAYALHPERFVAGSPHVARPPSRVLINPADEQPLVTAERLIQTPDEELATLCPTAPPGSGMPIIDLPGVSPSRAGAYDQSLST